MCLGLPVSVFAQWTFPDYRARLVLDIEETTVTTASLGFCFGGHIRTDGNDIRIVSVTGAPVKSQVMFCDPTGLSQIALQTIPGLRRYYVYFSNPKETAGLTEPWEPTSGLVLETRSSANDRHYAASLEEAKAQFGKSEPVLGKMFVPSIFFGESPFRVRDQVANYLKGFLNVKDEGEYSFATSSMDSSFALIDGKLVCQAPGDHGWTGEARFKGEITLTKGVHLVEYYHIQRDGPMQAVLVWKTPKGKNYERIPAEAWTPVTAVKIVGFEKAGLPFAADFDVTRAGDILRGDTQATIYQFKARSWGSDKPSSFAWDFGDGLKGAGETVEHVYFGLWQPTVKLTMTKGAAKDEFSRSVKIHPAEGQSDEQKLLPQAATILKTYSARDLDDASATKLIQFLKGAKLNEVFVKVIEEQMAAPAGIPPAKLDEYLPLLADAYLDGGQFAKALQRYDEWIAKLGSTMSPDARRARIRAAECLIHLRKFDEASQRHDALIQASGGGGIILTPVERNFERDKVRSAIRQQKFDGARDLLETFVAAHPVVLREDFVFFLRGQISFGLRKWEAAATDFEFVEHVEPRSNFIPEALLQSGRAYLELGKKAEATKALERVATRYGNSAFAETAKAELAKVKK